VTTKAYREAVNYALSLGLVDDGWNGEGHHTFRNPETGAAHSISSSMPDRARALLNTKADLRRCAGVDSRGRDAVEGERRQRRSLGPLSSGFDLAAAARERRRQPDRPTPTTRADLMREREAAYLELLACQVRDSRAERLAARVVELDERIRDTA